MSEKKINGNSQDTSFMSNPHVDYLNELTKHFEDGSDSTLDKLQSFAKYVPRTTMARFLTKYELFRKILDVQGCIVECGVFMGGGLMTWAQLSAILEPANHQRKIIGFDTFDGFPEIVEKDISDGTSKLCKEGLFKANSYDDLQKTIQIYDKSRYMNHIQKVELVRGDVCKTVPEFIEKNPHLIVSLLYLDLDIYKPTVSAINNLQVLMPKGSIIAFDELARERWPGETQALKDTLGIDKYKIHRFKFGTSISYIIKD